MQSLDPFVAFIGEHHILTFATQSDDGPHCATLFYAFDRERICFVVASDVNTEHIQNALKAPEVAGAIALETHEVGKIRGLQLKGILTQSIDISDDALYYAAFPYARVMQPTFWVLHVSSMKLTDNRFGFGKKLRWPEVLG